MTKPIIKISNISKKYKIRQSNEKYLAFRDILSGLIFNPFFLFKKDSHIFKKTITENFWALKNINLSIYKGETIGIIGHNGAGKSTLLKILSEITPPSEGEIEMLGTTASLLEVGTGFHPELSGSENIFLNGAMLGMTKQEIKNKFNQIIEFAGISKFLDTPVKRYSSGMYVRLAFSVAAHLEPDILIVDEVLAVGDAEFQRKCLGKMDEVSKKEGRTVIFVSHNMAAIQNLCKKCILLENGEIKMFDETEKVIEKYLDSNEKTESEIFFSDNNNTQFTKTTITNEKSEKTTSVPWGETFYINLWYNLKNELNNCQIGFELFNQNGLCIFTSTDQDTGKNINVIKKPGKYKTTIPINSKLLKTGKYFLKIYITIPKISVIDSPQKNLKIEITESKKTIKSLLSQGRHGIIEPVICWKTKKYE